MPEGASTPRRNATAAHTFAQALARHGVEVLFGQSIPSQLHLAAPEFGMRQIGYRAVTTPTRCAIRA